MMIEDSSETGEIADRNRQHLLPVYAPYTVVMERGEGVFLFDVDGNQYLDMMAGLGVNALGHAHPRMVAATIDQASKMVHLSPQYLNRNPGLLAERLCKLSGMAGVFFSTGGSEAVEGALKLARTHGRQTGNRLGISDKQGIVALEGSYHGRTFGSMSVTGQKKYSADFGLGLPGISFVERNNLAQLRNAITSTTCAILLEPMLGEGGVLPCSPEFLGEARRLADEHHALLIFDEIQVGLGRTGRWFAFEESGVRPDVLILGKPLGGGLPLSALLVTGELFHSFGLAKHGSTLGGSPLACRLGLEFLAVVEDEGLLERVRVTGAYLAERLAALVDEFDVAVESRGDGLIQALELNIPARPIAEAALERGVMLNCVQGNILRFLPPLIVEKVHIGQALDVLRDILLEQSQERAIESNLVGASA
jgi:acetylornithine/N-succinyldiaminopimelate aminotransferase